MSAADKAAQPDNAIWLRSTALGISRPFDPAHAKALLALEKKQGVSDWKKVPTPKPTRSSASG